MAHAVARGEPVDDAYAEALACLERLRDVRVTTSPPPPLGRTRLRRELAFLAHRVTDAPAGWLAELDTLFASLQSRAFKGELGNN